MSAETSGVDVFLATYAALSEDERGHAFERLRELRLDEAGVVETEMAKYIKSLRAVAEAIGHTPGVTEYQQVSKVLIAEGRDEVQPFSRVYKYFESWLLAQEALELSGETSLRAIEARFRHRRLGKPVRYSEDVLRETLAQAVRHFGRAPNVPEYVWWRERKLELARAQGEKRPFLPTDGPYRDRWRTWDAALIHFGYTPGVIGHRLERRERVFYSQSDPDLPDDLPVAKLADEAPEGLSLSEAEVANVREAYEAFPRRTRYVLTARLGLGIPKRILREVGDSLGLHLSRVQQLQAYALDILVEAVGEERKHTRRGLRAGVIKTLRALATE